MLQAKEHQWKWPMENRMVIPCVSSEAHLISWSSVIRGV